MLIIVQVIFEVSFFIIQFTFMAQPADCQRG